MFDRVWRLLRWFSPIAYAATGVAAIALVVVHFCNTAPAQTPPGSWLGLSALVGYAAWARRTARKEYREAKQWRPRPPLNEAPTIIFFAVRAKIAELNAATGTQEWPEPWRREF